MFLRRDSGILSVLRPRDIKLKGVRNGDTGLSTTSHRFSRKPFGKQSARVLSRERVVSQAVRGEFCNGLGRYLDRCGCSDAGVAFPRGDAA